MVEASQEDQLVFSEGEHILQRNQGGTLEGMSEMTTVRTKTFLGMLMMMTPFLS